MAISSSNKRSSPKVTAIKLQPTMPLQHTWQQGVFQWTSKFSTTKPAQNTKKQSPSSGTQNSNLSHWTCIAKTRLNKLFARSRTTFWQFLPVLTLPFHRTFRPSSATAELTLNLLCQATLNPRISAWEFFQGPFDFNKMPLCPVGCRILIHAKLATQQSWDFRAKPSFYIGPALDS
jgi:hypothetical protein